MNDMILRNATIFIIRNIFGTGKVNAQGSKGLERSYDKKIYATDKRYNRKI